MKNILKIKSFLKVILCLALSMPVSITVARDLNEVKQRGVLRHIGMPYGNFITEVKVNNQSNWTGLDIELMKGFANNIGVRYQFVEHSGDQLFGALTGTNIDFINNEVIYGQPSNIKGDVISSGLTILQWRKNIFDFSDPYFFSAVWLFARVDSKMSPITPSGSTPKDIENVKSQLAGHSVLTVEKSCLDAKLYDLQKTNAHIVTTDKYHNLIPAIIDHDAESTLMDVADGLAILDKWAGQIKVIGPISGMQSMGAAFSKKSPKLRLAFNDYLRQIRENGVYKKLAEKYYPNVYHFYPEFFANTPPEVSIY